jgi:multiple sugar transport system permease protein
MVPQMHRSDHRTDAARPGPRAEPSAGGRIDWAGYVLVAFFTLPFLAFNVMPVFFGAYVAFTEWRIIGVPEWIGTANFEEAFADPWVAGAFRNVAVYTLIIVPGVTCLGLAAALFVNQRWPLSTLARTLFFAPYVVSATVIGLIWVWMLDTQYGLVNHYLGYLGIEQVGWLTSREWSIVGVSIASIWWDMGLAFILFLAALQDIPKDMTEAASVDGAGPLRRLWFIILPMMRPVISMVVTLQVISTMRIFSQVYVMTNGGPAGSSASPIHYIYQAAIQRNDFGLASAVAVLLFFVIVTLAVGLRLVVRERS